MDGISQVAAAPDVSSASEVFALKKSLQLNGQSVLSLVDGTSDTASELDPAAANPPHLGQRIDVRV